MRALVRPVAEWEIAHAIIPPACQRIVDDASTSRRLVQVRETATVPMA
jgi:hypothetical protein